MKELHGQSLSNELAESDRLAAGIPGQVAAKNILFSKLWVQLKSIFGTNNWSAREFKSSPCIVVYNKAQYILDESVAPLPFTSTDFTTELASNIWMPLGSSGASTSANVALTTPLAGADDQDELNIYLFNRKKEYQIETNGETTGLISFSQLEKIVTIPTKYNIDTLTITPSGGGAAIPLVTAGGVVVTLPINLAIGTYNVALTYSAGMSVSSTIIQTQLQ